MKGWKTIVFNVLTIAVLIMQQMGTDLGISAPVITAVVAVINIVLRYFTDTKIFTSGELK